MMRSKTAADLFSEAPCLPLLLLLISETLWHSALCRPEGTLTRSTFTYETRRHFFVYQNVFIYQDDQNYLYLLNARITREIYVLIFYYFLHTSNRQQVWLPACNPLLHVFPSLSAPLSCHYTVNEKATRAKNKLKQKKTMVITSKQFNFSFIRQQDTCPKVKVFVSVCIYKR